MHKNTWDPKRGEHAESIAPRLRQAKKTGQHLPESGAAMKPILCPCGFEKDMVHGVSICQHCDDLCTNRAGCHICGQYSVAVNQRVNAEHAKERANG